MRWLILLLLAVGAAAGEEAEVAATRARLRALLPDPARQALARRLIRELESDDSARREEAARRVLRIGAAAIPELEAAVEKGGPEQRRAATPLLEVARGRIGSAALFELFHSIVRGRWKGLAPEVLAALPLVPESAGTREALRATATRDDAELLRRALATPGASRVRVAALDALIAVEGADVALFHLRDGDDRVRVVAARARADAGDANALAVLGALLGSGDRAARRDAAALLRAIRGGGFGFTAYAPEASRATARRAWLVWIETRGPTARWTTPLPRHRLLRQRTLVADYNGGRIFELDGEGREIWSHPGLHQPWAISGLENGHRLVSLLVRGVLIEFDEQGRESWRSGKLPGQPTSVQRLDDGTTLVALQDRDQLLELRRDGSFAWKIALPGKPIDARRLEDGSTLVTLMNRGRVVEVNRAGEIQWSLDGLKQPYSASRLANGNTLVTEVGYSGKGRVLEMTRAGKIVWQYGPLRLAYSAQRLPNGRTLICDAEGVREILGQRVVRRLTRTRGAVNRALRY